MCDVGQKQQLSVEKKKKIEWNSPEAEEHILMCEIKFGVKLFWPLTAQLWPSNNVHGPFTVFLLVNKELLYFFFYCNLICTYSQLMWMHS